MRILVCGGRDFGNVPDPDHELHAVKHAQARFVMETLDRIAEEFSVNYDPYDNWLPADIVIISGMAKGADTCAVDWAVINWCHVEEYRAEWDKYGKRAGYIRNQQMLDEGEPDLVVAFPGGRGTEMMKDIARKAGVPVREIHYGPNKKGSNEAADRASASPQGGPE